MTDLTLRGYKNLSEEKLAKILSEEAEKMFGSASSEGAEKDSAGEPFSTRSFNYFWFGVISQYVKALVLKYRKVSG